MILQVTVQTPPRETEEYGEHRCSPTSPKATQRVSPPTGNKVGVQILVVLPAWNGEVWAVNVVEVSNHTCWPSVIWAVNMTKTVCWPGY